MFFSFRRVNAILIKDWKDLMKNSYILFTLAFPLVFAIWIGKMDIENTFTYIFPINFSLVICGCFVQAAMVAEEKEKSTLRGLLLSPATTSEILVGKSALSAITTIIVIIASIFLSNFEVPSLLWFSLTILLCLIIYITIGTLLGLLSRTVMETTIIGMPVLVLLGMGSVLKAVIDNDFLTKVIDFLPNEQFSNILINLNQGNNFNDISKSLLILVAWVFVTLIITFITYGKRRFDK
ncbi:ABC transporter permease [Priestia megaterium]|uniref:ABC transporter permease n=1 Tax=Priestia megaterium TaxID=1404 RepID=A0A3D8WUL2_PRIMG|nr:ABC transporter permease [Priestia megaterium]MDH3169159.1 ABC transporter permease [Priestia megaterium]MDH3169207.1 ABC transporter permease [Priestia megaterium]RDZ07688.1 ABC transporter permease [Priestia megaterium]